MLKLKLQYFGHLMQRVDSLEKTLMLGGIGGRRRRGRQRMRWLVTSLTRWTWISVNSWSWWWTGRPGMLRFMGSQRVGHDWETELNWKIVCEYDVFFFIFMAFIFIMIKKSAMMLLESIKWDEILKHMTVPGSMFHSSVDSCFHWPNTKTIKAASARSTNLG